MSIWVEKYRPQELKDLILADSTKKNIENIIKSKDVSENFTNSLYSGSPGTGKTSCAKLMVKLLDLPYLYINASEENGVDVLRTRIKDFATSQTIDGKLKVVILDESDGLSPVFQSALRGVIESTHKTTRYILTCNYPEKIIVPLHSRLKEITFSKVDEKQIFKRVIEILKEEQIIVPKEQSTNLIDLVKKYHPDVRKILNYLQYFSSSGTLNIVFTEMISADIFEQIILSTKNKRLSELRTILRNNKLDYEGLIRKVFEEVLNTSSKYFPELTEAKRAEIILLCADTLYKNAFVLDKEINFAAFSIELAKIGI